MKLLQSGCSIFVGSIGLIVLLGGATHPAQETGAADALQGIEKLHLQDVSATLAHDPKALAELFTEDAVLLVPGEPPLIGRKAILAHNEKDHAARPSARVLNYTPNIKDLQLRGGWAFEWDTFEARFKESDMSQAQSFRAKALRVLERQPDGSWKFARVMWNTAEEH